MTPLARVHLWRGLARVGLACKKPELERREHEGPADADNATVTSVTVVTESGGADASSPPPPPPRSDADAGTSERMRLPAFGAIVEDAGNGRGAAVTRVTPGSQAASVLRRGDVITAVDVAPVQGAEDLGRYLDKTRRGLVVLTVERSGTSSYVVVTLD